MVRKKNKPINETLTIDITDNIKNKIKNMIPIYIIFNNSHSWKSKLIAKFTKGPYSHVSLSFLGLSEIISFGDNKKNNGIIIENIYEFYSNRKPSKLKVIALFLPYNDYKKIYKIVSEFRKNIRKYRYSLKELLLFPFLPKRSPRDIKDKEKYFCSQFVIWALGNISDKISNINVDPNTVSEMLSDTKDFIKLILFEGDVNDFDEEFITEFENSIKVDKNKIHNKIEKDIGIERIFYLKESNDIVYDDNYILGILNEVVYEKIGDDNNNSKYINKLNELILSQ